MSSTLPPKSAVHALTAYGGLFGLLGSLFYIRGPLQSLSVVEKTLFVGMVYWLIVSFIDFFVFKNYLSPAAGLCFKEFKPSWERFFLKLLGILGCLGFCGLCYFLFPEYRGSFYDPFWEAARLIGPWLLGLMPIYILFVDGYMNDPKDGYYYLGRALFFRSRKDFNYEARVTFLSWVVKAYFLPLMWVYSTKNLKIFMSWDFSNFSWPHYYHQLYNLIFFIDLIIASAGYTFSLRIFDTHIRSVEPTIKGWVVALMCYQPFWSVFGRWYLNYHDALTWDKYFSVGSVGYYIWSAMILFVNGFYVWATIMLACRFSNLTHRGIVTNGPYAIFKHPAYVAKNVSFWLNEVPFFTANLIEAVKQSILLLLLNLVYWLRAKTEESHLSKDPIYKDYQRHMNHKWKRWKVAASQFFVGI